MNRWSKAGVLDQVFEQLQRHQFMRLKLEARWTARASRSIPNRRGKKNGPQAIGKSRGGWTTKLHLAAADARTSVTFCPPAKPMTPRKGASCSPASGPSRSPVPGDGAYEGNETRQLFAPIVPPRQNRTAPWEYDRELYKRATKSSACSAA